MIDFFKNRPMCLACTVFIVLSAALYSLTIYLKAIFAAVIIIFAVIAILFNKRLFVIVIPAIAAMSVGILYFNVYYESLQRYTYETDIPYTIEASVIKVNSYAVYGSYYDIEIDSVNRVKIKTKAKLETKYDSDISAGEKFTMKVFFAEMEDNILGFPEKTYNISKGFMLKAVSDKENSDYEITGYENNLIQKINRYFTNIYITKSKGDNGFLLSGLMLGNKSDVPDVVIKNFRALGISHVLSVSGMHLTVVIGSFMWILRKLSIGFKKRILLTMIFIVFYILLTGCSASVLRSGIMYILFIFSMLLGRRNDTVTSLFLAVSLIYFFSPNAILDIGLGLSFLSTLGILTLGNYLCRYTQKLPIILKFIIESFIFTISATLYSLPLVWVYFGEISLISPFSNVIFGFPFTLLMYLSPFILIFNFYQPLQSFVLLITDILIEYILFLSELMSKLSEALISLRYEFTMYIAILFVVIVIILILMGAKRPSAILIPYSICIFAFIVCLNLYNFNQRDIVHIVFQTEKRNDGFIVRSDEKIIICDISDGSYGFAKMNVNIASTILYSTNIDVYMLTHYHQRHISSCYKLMQNIFIKEFLLPEAVTETEVNVKNAITKLAEENGISVQTYSRKEIDNYICEGLYINTYPYTLIRRSTHPVLGLNIHSNTQNILYLGSSMYESEYYDSVDFKKADADYVIYGIHGPKQEPYAPTITDSYIEFIIKDDDE